MRYLFVMLFVVACGSESQSVAGVPILAFHEVGSGIYRGAQPTAEGMQYLKSIGIKTIIDVNNDPDKLRTELERADGIQIISVPLSGFWAPSGDDVEKIEAILADPRVRPLYLHCEHGHDRTGLLMGLHRNWHEGWSKEQAHEEMLALGFHTVLFPLERFFWGNSR